MALNVSTGTIGDQSPALGAFPANHKFYEKTFITIANPILIYEKFGMPKGIPSNSSNTISFQKVNKLALAKTPLTEGVTPTEQQFQMSRIEKAVNQYGGFATTTDRLSEETINTLTTEFTKRMGEQGAETMNEIVRDDLLLGTNVRFANGAVDQDNTTSAPVAADFDYMSLAFMNEKVKPINPLTTGSENFGTTAIMESYVVVCHPDAKSLLEALDDGNGETFTHAKDYAGQVSLFDKEYGAFKNFRFILDTESAQVVNGVSTKTVNRSLVFGQDAYGVTTIGSSDMKLIIKPLGSAGTADPLDQRATIGWKAKKAAVIIQQTYMFRYEFALD